MNRKVIKTILVIGLLDILLMTFAIMSVSYFGLSAGYIALSTISMGLVTFFGFLMMGLRPNENSPINAGVFRMAITASVIALYLSIVSMTTYFRNWSDTIQPITETMLSNFTTIVGVVIAFYFTSSAYVEGQEKKKDKSNNDDK